MLTHRTVTLSTVIRSMVRRAWNDDGFRGQRGERGGGQRRRAGQEPPRFIHVACKLASGHVSELCGSATAGKVSE